MAFVMHRYIIHRIELIQKSDNFWLFYYPIPADCLLLLYFYGIFKGLEV
jgi:hypothetical protein